MKLGASFSNTLNISNMRVTRRGEFLIRIVERFVFWRRTIFFGNFPDILHVIVKYLSLETVVSRLNTSYIFRTFLNNKYIIYYYNNIIMY